MILNNPLVFLPVLPFKKGSAVVAIVVGIGVGGRAMLEISCISVSSLRPRQGAGATLIRPHQLGAAKQYEISLTIFTQQRQRPIMLIKSNLLGLRDYELHNFTMPLCWLAFPGTYQHDLELELLV